MERSVENIGDLPQPTTFKTSSASLNYTIGKITGASLNSCVKP
jgi:hypothetical protein